MDNEVSSWGRVFHRIVGLIKRKGIENLSFSSNSNMNATSDRISKSSI